VGERLARSDLSLWRKADEREEGRSLLLIGNFGMGFEFLSLSAAPQGARSVLGKRSGRCGGHGGASLGFQGSFGCQLYFATLSQVCQLSSVIKNLATIFFLSNRILLHFFSL